MACLNQILWPLELKWILGTCVFRLYCREPGPHAAALDCIHSGSPAPQPALWAEGTHQVGSGYRRASDFPVLA